MIRVLLILMFFIAPTVYAADALYGTFSQMSPPAPMAPGTIWNVTVNSSALTVDPESLDFAFPTGPTRNYVRRSSERKGPTTITWIGVSGRDEAIIHAENGVVSGVVFNGARHFELEAIQNGTRFEWVDQTKAGEPSLRLPTGTPSPTPAMRSFAGRTEANRARAASVDVLFMYTPQAFEAVGGSVDGLANIRSQINSAVAATNNAYLQSDAKMHINVAGIEAVPGTQQDTCIPPAPICQSPQYGQAILLDLTNTESNAAIATRRDELSADTVVLIIENGGGAAPPNQAIILCGVANQMRAPTLGPAFAPFAYSVVRRSCATGNLTLAHELGHNMGLEHHPFEYFGSLPPDPTFPWSFAHSIGGTTSGFHSVMSTNYECVSQNLQCSLIPRFSNPDNTWPVNNGGVITQVSTGVANLRDNARTLRSTGLIAEGWRAGYFENGFESP